jgi:sigma-B regulation protein RsbU (phosphoserine phosphatase)
MDKQEMQFQGHKNTQALLEMARALGTTCDLDRLLQMVIRYSMDLLDAERATLFLYDREKEELYSRIAEGTEEIRISVNTGLAGAAARSLEIINVPDAYKDPRFNQDVDKNTGYRTRNLLSCPLTDYDGKLVGVLQVLNKKEGAFSENDISLAAAFSAQAGVALQRANLLEEHLEKLRLEDSLRIAKEIQEGLLPSEAPELPGFDIACWNRPCDETGGDYCDFLVLDGDRLVVTFGDVTGHGVGPALVSCATRAMIRALSSVNDDIENVMCRVNNLLSEDLPENRFVTVFLGLLDANTGQLHYCSAGQGPLLWLHADTSQVDSLGAGGIPMGIIPDFGPFRLEKITMKAQDLFVLLTDGFYEWARLDGELFGVERVIEIMQVNQNRSATEILFAVKEAVEAFADTKQADDLTAIIIKKT